jgi:hypothetical protein
MITNMDDDESQRPGEPQSPPPIPPGQVRPLTDPEAVMRWFAAHESRVVTEHDPLFPLLDEHVTEAEELVAKLAEFRGDPIGFVRWGFDWGQGELAGYDGPFEWQQRVLEAIKDGLPLDRAIRVAVVSGHGVGKSCLVSWILLWSMSTAAGTKGVCTAGTEDQLKTKLWSELSNQRGLGARTAVAHRRDSLD